MNLSEFFFSNNTPLKSWSTLPVVTEQFLSFEFCRSRRNSVTFKKKFDDVRSYEWKCGFEFLEERPAKENGSKGTKIPCVGLKHASALFVAHCVRSHVEQCSSTDVSRCKYGEESWQFNCRCSSLNRLWTFNCTFMGTNEEQFCRAQRYSPNSVKV